MIDEKEKISNLSFYTLLIAFIFTVLSQISAIQLFEYFMYFFWILTFIFSFKKNSRISKFTLLFIIVYLLIFTLSLILQIFNYNYIFPNYLQIMMIPLFMTIVSNNYIELPEKKFQYLIKTYIISSLIFAIYVQMTYFSSYTSWLAQESYVFLQKNSAAQLWGTSIFMILFLVKENKNWKRFLYYILLFYFLFLIFIFQCRTAILGLAISVLIYTLFKSKRKIPILLSYLAVLTFMWNFEPTRGFINQALLLNKYANSSLDTFSSGRLTLWKNAYDLFSSSPLFGIGKYYVDCSYLLILTETGVLGFALIETVWISKILINIKQKDKNNKNNIFLFIITIFFIVESILEGYPPFGPGASCFAFWFISNLITTRNSINYNREKRE